MVDRSVSSYQVLARRCRPMRFSDLVGQDVLVKTLTNALRTGRLAHAFIFSGIRGVGKTTTARLLARALNCEGRPLEGDGVASLDPCGICPQCLAIGEDRHVDVVEVDAASRTGVDDIRDLLEGVYYQPTFGRYKVYIIDEVHMLSKSAFNALLKTLEEPPLHVKFIFATTDIQKIPLTVLSRCQRFDLRRVGPEILTPHFEALLEKEAVPFEKMAVSLIAKAADGSVRDGQSLLEQAIVAGGNAGLTETLVKEMLGLGDRSLLVDLLDRLFQGHIQEALGQVRSMIEKGMNPRQVLQELLEIVHVLSLMKAGIDSNILELTMASEAVDLCSAMVQRLSMPTLIRTWQILLKGVEEVTVGVLPETALEMVLMRVTHLQRFFSEEPSQVSQKAVPSLEQNTILPKTFEEVVSLFKENREPILADQLRTQIAVTSYHPGRVEFSASEDDDGNFLREAIRLLTRWTGIPWNFVPQKAVGGETLATKEHNDKEKQLAQAQENPQVQEILKAFPSSTIDFSH